MTDLPPDVRNRAMLVAEMRMDEIGYPLNTASRSAILSVVDAVTAVVAPEISRLQARVEELEADHQTFWAKKPGGVEMWEQHLRNLVDGTDEYFEPFAMEIAVAELNRQRARIEELEAANAAVEEENDLLRDVIQQKHTRIEELTTALTDALELAGYTGVRGKEHGAKYRNAYAVLAKGGDLVPLREERDALLARIVVLEADIAHCEDEKWFHLHFQGLYSQALRAMARRAALLRREWAQTARRRVTALQENKELRAALTDAVEMLEGAAELSMGLIHIKCRDAAARARAALAAGAASE